MAKECSSGSQSVSFELSKDSADDDLNRVWKEDNQCRRDTKQEETGHQTNAVKALHDHAQFKRPAFRTQAKEPKSVADDLVYVTSVRYT
jgi:hypothetical protein